MSILWQLISICSGLVVLLSGCATRLPAIRASPNVTQPAGNTPLVFRTVSIACTAEPATYSFQKAKGKRSSAKEGVSDATALAAGAPAMAVVLSGAALSDSDDLTSLEAKGALGVVAGAVVFVAAPVVAASSVVRSWKTLSPAELAEGEAALTRAMNEMASQQHFQAFLLKAGAEKFRDQFVPMQLNGLPMGEKPACDVILEARVEDLRLERLGSDEGSYFLRIMTRAKLLRAVDGVLLYDQVTEYWSGLSLFVDWTVEGAFEAVAETGYRALAQYIMDSLARNQSQSEQRLIKSADSLQK